jgi:hypothetical protein
VFCLRFECKRKLRDSYITLHYITFLSRCALKLQSIRPVAARPFLPKSRHNAALGTQNSAQMLGSFPPLHATNSPLSSTLLNSVPCFQAACSSSKCSHCPEPPITTHISDFPAITLYPALHALLAYSLVLGPCHVPNVQESALSPKARLQYGARPCGIYTENKWHCDEFLL